MQWSFFVARMEGETEKCVNWKLQKKKETHPVQTKNMILYYAKRMEVQE